MRPVDELYPEAYKRRLLGKCPFCGEATVSVTFRDDLSRTEAKISGLCQPCQDIAFAEPVEWERPLDDEETPAP